MTYQDNLINQIKTSIDNDLKNHVINVRHHEGLYRHYYCAAPGTGIMHFNVTTWPGYLCYSGDMGCYVFRRNEDMIPWIRGSCMSYDYAASKCEAEDRDGIREYRIELVKEQLDHDLKYEMINQDTYDELMDQISDELSQYEAQRAFYDSGHYYDEVPSFEAFTFRFLWCLYALKWFCDNVKEV